MRYQIFHEPLHFLGTGTCPGLRLRAIFLHPFDGSPVRTSDRLACVAGSRIYRPSGVLEPGRSFEGGAAVGSSLDSGKGPSGLRLGSQYTQRLKSRNLRSISSVTERSMARLCLTIIAHRRGHSDSPIHRTRIARDWLEPSHTARLNRARMAVQHPSRTGRGPSGHPRNR